MNSSSKVTVLISHTNELLAMGLDAAFRSHEEFEVIVGSRFPNTCTADVVVADFDSGIRLYRSPEGSTRLESLSTLDGVYPASHLSPLLPEFERRDDFATVMRTVERSAMPAGLYGWKGSLYVLRREPKGNSTRWLLSRVDPKADHQIVSTIEIPARASHLTVVPGPSNWAFIEKGPVRGHRDQSVLGILYVPSSRIEGVSRGNVCQ